MAERLRPRPGRRPHFAESRMRRVLEYALDRRALAAAVPGLAQPGGRSRRHICSRLTFREGATPSGIGSPTTRVGRGLFAAGHHRAAVPASDARRLERIASLPSPRRETAAGALALELDRDAYSATFGENAIPELVSRRLGCLVHEPVYPGLDLAALCVTGNRR